MGNDKPKSVKELFEFYYERFKPIYCHVEAINQPPVEMLFEINAAFDHLSRLWHYQESEEHVVSTAAAHLKRGCFDAFKILVKETRDQYDALRAIDTSIIDNGVFERGMLSLFSEIKQGASCARIAEGDSRDADGWHKAFDVWEPVYEKCVRFEQDFFLSPKVEWAKRKMMWKPWKNRLEGFVVGLVAALVGAWIWWIIGVDRNTNRESGLSNNISNITRPATTSSPDDSTTPSRQTPGAAQSSKRQP